MSTFTARIPQLGSRGLPGHQIVEVSNVAPGAEVGNIGDVAVRHDDNGDVWLYGQKTEAGWPSSPRLLRGPAGNAGWSPVLGVVVDEGFLIFRVTDWTGGAGTKPAAGLYVGPSGLVENIADATRFGLVGAAVTIGFNNDSAELPGEPESVQDALDEIVAGYISTLAAQDLTPEQQMLARENMGTIGNVRTAPIILTSSGTYTPSPGCKGAIVELVGGGGSGAASTNSGGAASAGGGGGAGGRSRKFIANPVPATVIIGADGSAPSAGANNGNAGGNTSYDDGTNVLTANGGGGGIHVANSSTVFVSARGGEGGTATGGNLNAAGANGEQGIVFSGSTALSGSGASGLYGRGGRGHQASGGGNSNAGEAAQGFGAGGAGARNGSSGSAQAGGAGAPGVVIIWELF